VRGFLGLCFGGIEGWSKTPGGAADVCGLSGVAFPVLGGGGTEVLGVNETRKRDAQGENKKSIKIVEQQAG